MAHDLFAFRTDTVKQATIFRLLKIAALLVVFARAASQTLFFSDPDQGWHLRAGEWILEHGQVMTSNLFTYTLEGNVWVNHEWLYEMVLATLSTLDLWWLAQLLALLLGIGPVLLWIMRSRDPLSLLALTIGGIAIAEMVFVRAQVISIALFAILVELLRRQSLERTLPSPKACWTLALLFVLWSNLHGGFVAGLAYLALWLFVRQIDAWRRGVLSIRRSAEAGGLLVLGTAMTLVNPYGTALWGLVIDMTFTPANAFISEWASPLLSWQPSDALFLALLLGAIWSALSRRDTLGIIPGFVLVGYLLHVRFLPLCFLASAPLLVSEGQRLWGMMEKGAQADMQSANVSRGIARGISLVIVVVIMLGMSSIAVPVPHIDPYPATREALFVRNITGGQIYHDSGFGSAMIRMQDGKRTFSGGHVPHQTDATGFSPFLYPIRAHMDPELPIDPVFDRYDIRVALVFAGKNEGEKGDEKGGLLGRIRETFHPIVPSAINARLRESGWCEMYQDDIAVIYVKPGTVLCGER